MVSNDALTVNLYLFILILAYLYCVVSYLCYDAQIWFMNMICSAYMSVGIGRGIDVCFNV